MDNLEKTEIKVKLSSTFWNKAPRARIYINDKCMFDDVVTVEQTIDLSVELSDGKHKLIVELYDKDKYQTVIQDDKIVKDQLLNIDSVSFDDIDIGYLSHRLSKYYPDQNFYSNSVPLLVNNCVNLGYNGRWELEFTTPIYIWLLENI